MVAPGSVLVPSMEDFEQRSNELSSWAFMEALLHIYDRLKSLADGN